MEAQASRLRSKKINAGENPLPGKPGKNVGAIAMVAPYDKLKTGEHDKTAV